MSELPAFPPWVCLPAWLWLCLAGIAFVLARETESLWPLVVLLLAAMAQFVYVGRLVRCPQCGARMGTFRGEDSGEGRGHRYRLQLRCARCRARWGSGSEGGKED